MMIAPKNGRLRVVTQNDHAHFAAELLSLWITDGLPAHPRRSQLLFAARDHDNGWREADAAPHHDPDSGRPHDFISLPDPLRREIWHRGVRRFAAREPWGALLILRHALALRSQKDNDAAWEELLDEWRELENELLAVAADTGTDAGKEALEDDYTWVDLSDLTSLMVCCGLREPFSRYGFTGRVEPGESDDDFDVLRLDPFPLAGVTSFRIPCRYIPDRVYRSDTDLAVELAAARWRESSLRVMPA